MSIQYIQDSKTYLSGYVSTITPAVETKIISRSKVSKYDILPTDVTQLDFY